MRLVVTDDGDVGTVNKDSASLEAALLAYVMKHASPIFLFERDQRRKLLKP
jgi:hypothetical protein